MRFLPSLGLAIVLAPASLFAQLVIPNQTVTAQLTGYQEVPAVSSDASGTFMGVVNLAAAGPNYVAYAMQWSNLSSSAVPTEIDLSFGQENVNGGTLTVICGGDAGHLPCQNGIARGRINPSDLLVVNNQNIGTGDFDKFLRALFAGKVYVTIKTSTVPTGEIRGQIKADAFR